MIKPGTGKGGGVMAYRAILSSRKMVPWLDGRDGSRISVARCTVVNDTGMIEHRVGKGAWYVTDAAILSGRNVAGIFLGSYWSRGRVIAVTCSAITHNTSMIKGAILEIVANSMTRSTVCCCGRMWRCRIIRLS